MMISGRQPGKHTGSKGRKTHCLDRASCSKGCGSPQGIRFFARIPATHFSASQYTAAGAGFYPLKNEGHTHSG